MHRYNKKTKTLKLIDYQMRKLFALIAASAFVVIAHAVKMPTVKENLIQAKIQSEAESHDTFTCGCGDPETYSAVDAGFPLTSNAWYNSGCDPQRGRLNFIKNVDSIEPPTEYCSSWASKFTNPTCTGTVDTPDQC